MVSLSDDICAALLVNDVTRECHLLDDKRRVVDETRSQSRRGDKQQASDERTR